MSDLLSLIMWRALFEVADRGATSNVITRNTIDALVKRRLIEHGVAGRWQLTPYGQRVIDRAMASNDVT